MEQQSDLAIVLENVTRSYLAGLTRRRVRGVEDISMAIAYGESVGFVGHNGAGKSTTIRTILGLQKVESGRVLLRGRDPSDPLSRVGVSYVPENPLLYDSLTVREVLEFSARMHGWATDALARQCRKWMERFGLVDHERKMIRQLSKGLTQRTALAAALVNEPEVLILDEPLSGLDPVGRSEVVDVLCAYQRTGRTMLFSSHILNDVERMAHRVVFMYEGRVVPEIALAEAQGEHEVYEVLVDRCPAREEGFVHEGGSVWRASVPVDRLPRLLDSLRAEGVVLRSCTPTASLERRYARLVSHLRRAGEMEAQG